MLLQGNRHRLADGSAGRSQASTEPEVTKPEAARRQLDARVRRLMNADPSYRPTPLPNAERFVAGAPLPEGLGGEQLVIAYVWARVELLRIRAALRPIADHWDATRSAIRAATLRRPARKLRGDPDRTTHDVLPRLRRSSDFAHKLKALRRRNERLYKLVRRLAALVDAEAAENLCVEAAEAEARRAEAAALKAQRDRAARTKRRELKLRKIDAVRSPKARLSNVLAALRYERRINAADPLLITALERRRDNLLEKTLRRSRDC